MRIWVRIRFWVQVRELLLIHLELGLAVSVRLRVCFRFSVTELVECELKGEY